MLLKQNINSKWVTFNTSSINCYVCALSVCPCLKHVSKGALLFTPPSQARPIRMKQGLNAMLHVNVVLINCIIDDCVKSLTIQCNIIMQVLTTSVSNERE